jgi:hypothetical protein
MARARKGPTSPSTGDAIHDGLITPLAPSSRSWGEAMPILAFQDHLLRRFGRIELIRLRDEGEFEGRRTVADEVWALVEGAADVLLADERQDSPTRGARQSHRLEAPTRLLLPFGVHLRIVARSGAALLLRIMTHSEAEDPPVSGS